MRNTSERWARYGGHALLGLRVVALLAVIYLSLHHWMREGYWEFSGIWHYGLPLLDPRVPAALLFGLLSAVFWNCLALPVALWLAARIPPDAAGRRLVVVVLALGLGTRGVVGPLIMRAAAGAPLVVALPGAIGASSALAHPYAARWLVLLTQLWWMLPLLIAAFWLIGWPAARQPRVLRTIRGLLVAYAMCQPLDAAYLLTAGGPHGATQSLTLIAFQEGFGRQEFGYASVLTALMCLALLPVAWFLRLGLPAASEQEPSPPTTRSAWRVLGLLVLLPLACAAVRVPGRISVPSSAWLAAGVSLGLALAGGAWSAFLSGGLVPNSLPQARGLRAVAKYWALLFPPLVLVLPMIRPWGYHTGVTEAGVLCLGMVVFAPHLALAVGLRQLLAVREVAPRAAQRIAGLAVAWAIWSELGVDLMLSQTRHAALPLQGWLVWELSTVLRASPLAVPGWPLAWAGGTLLAGLALGQLVRVLTPVPSLPDSARVPKR